jgi:hypothetical protein
MGRVGQNHACIGIYGVYTVFLAGKLPYIRSYTVCIYGCGQPKYVRYTDLRDEAPLDVDSLVRRGLSAFANLLSYRGVKHSGTTPTNASCGFISLE